MINKDGILEITDGAGDTVKVQISNITGYAYVSVNDDTQVRLIPENIEEVVAYLTPKAEPTQDTYYLIRQRKDNPLKVKVMFANTSDSKHFLSRSEADAHQERMTRQHGTTYKFFIVKEVV